MEKRTLNHAVIFVVRREGGRKRRERREGDSEVVWEMEREAGLRDEHRETYATRKWGNSKQITI